MRRLTNGWPLHFQPTLMLVYHCHMHGFTPKIAIFRRAGMREGGSSLPLAFQYLILMIWRPSDLNLVMISSLASKCQHFKLRGLQFHSIKWLKNGHPNFKVLAFWSQLRYHDQIQIIRSKESNVEKLVGVATLPLSFPPWYCHFRSKNEIFYTFLHTILYINLLVVTFEQIKVRL